MNAHVQNVCRPGAGAETCRYLMMGPVGWECGKLSPAFKTTLDERVRQNTIVARGDNCDGQPTEVLNA